MSNRRLLIGFAIVVNLAVLATSRPHWFSELNDHVVRAESPLYSELLDLSTAEDFNWRVPEYELPAPDYADLFLELVRTPGMPQYGYWHSFDLLVQVEAKGESESYVVADRSVRSYLDATSERPFKSTHWTGGRAAYRLGKIAVLPRETLTIKLSVLRPDPALAKAEARLKLLPEHDPVVRGHILAFWMFRDGCLLLAVVAVFYLGVRSWKETQQEADP